MCTSGASLSLPSFTNASLSPSRLPSLVGIAISPPATRSQMSCCWATAARVKRRYVAGSTEATVIARFSTSAVPIPSRSTAATPSRALIASTTSSESASWLKMSMSAGNVESVSFGGGSTACSVSTAGTVPPLDGVPSGAVLVVALPVTPVPASPSGAAPESAQAASTARQTPATTTRRAVCRGPRRAPMPMLLPLSEPSS